MHGSNNACFNIKVVNIHVYIVRTFDAPIVEMVSEVDSRPQ